MHYVIIGSSAAGIKAAETLRSLDEEAEITVISEENEPPYSRCLLAEYLAGNLSRGDLVFRAGDFYGRNKIRARLGERVASVKPQQHEVVLDSGETVGYDKLLVATGSSSTCPPLPGVDKVGSMGLRNIRDADQILEQCHPGNKAVIIGGGFVGLEAAYALNQRGLEVTVVEMAPHILALQMDETAASILADDMEQVGIRIITGIATREMWAPALTDGSGTDPEKLVILEDGTELTAHLVLTCTGTRPNTDLLEGTGAVINRGLVVNQYMETCLPDIYAAGDVCESVDIVSGEQALSPIWPNAVIQGKTSAYNMAGRPRKATPLLGMQNAVEFRAVPAIAAGYSTAKPAPGREIYTLHQPGRGIYRKIVIEDNVIIGMIFVGEIQNAGVVAALIRKQADVSAVKDKLLDRNFNFGYFWPLGRKPGAERQQEAPL